MSQFLVTGDSEETVWYIYPWFYTLQYAGAVLLL